MTDADSAGGKDGKSPRPRGNVDMVGKALHVLMALGEHPEGTSLTDLANEVAYPLSTTHRLITSLSRHGFVEYMERSRRYSVGLKVFELGHRVSQARGFTGTALPIMQRVTERTGEPTLMSVIDGDELVFVHNVSGPGNLQIKGEPGKRGPLHCTAMGKVLVAFQAPLEQERLVETLLLQRYTPRTITGRRRFRDEIERIREHGYGSTDEEHDIGIRAVAVPVLDPEGVAIAALATAATAYRTSMEDLEAQVPVLFDAARELSILLPRG